MVSFDLVGLGKGMMVVQASFVALVTAQVGFFVQTDEDVDAHLVSLDGFAFFVFDYDFRLLVPPVKITN